MDPLTKYIRFATVLVRRDRILHQLFREPNRMSKFSAVSDRMRQEHEADGKAADEMMERLDAHAKRRPEVVQRGHDWIKAQLEDEIGSMESDLTKFSNERPTGGGDGTASTKSG